MDQHTKGDGVDTTSSPAPAEVLPSTKESVMARCPCGAMGIPVLVVVRARARSGPAMVASAAFREGWEGINWGSKVGEA